MNTTPKATPRVSPRSAIRTRGILMAWVSNALSGVCRMCGASHFWDVRLDRKKVGKQSHY
jgi:hypothetical protein